MHLTNILQKAVVMVYSTISAFVSQQIIIHCGTSIIYWCQHMLQ